MHVQRIMWSCLLFFTCFVFYAVLVSCLVHSPHTSVFGTSEIKKKKSLTICMSVFMVLELCCLIRILCERVWGQVCLFYLSVKADLWKVLGAVKKGPERCFGVVCWIRCMWLFWTKIKLISPNSASEELEKQFSSVTCCNSQADSTVRSHC